MSGAAQSRNALLAAAEKGYGPTFAAGKAYAAAFAEAKKATDVVDMMRTAGALVLAAEALKDAAAAAEKDMRAKLAEQMMDTGCTSFDAEHHTIYLSRKPSFVSIEDESMLPDDYRIQPEPVLDKKRITAELKAGELVAGCTLIRPNDMTLNIRTKKESV